MAALLVPNLIMLKLENELMLALGYKKYIAQGGDWGSMITKWKWY